MLYAYVAISRRRLATHVSNSFLFFVFFFFFFFVEKKFLPVISIRKWDSNNEVDYRRPLDDTRVIITRNPTTCVGTRLA